MSNFNFIDKTKQNVKDEKEYLPSKKDVKGKRDNNNNNKKKDYEKKNKKYEDDRWN